MLPEEIKPLLSDEFVPINAAFRAHYSTYRNGTQFIRAENSWMKYPKADFITPVSNYYVADPYNKGVQFGAYEHVSVCISGSSTYHLKSLDTELTYEWTTGAHNVENGLGYLPEERFLRTFNNDFALCCMLETPDRDRSQKYGFEIVRRSDGTYSLPMDCEFVHVALGQVGYNGQAYSQKANIYNVLSDAVLDFTVPSIVILGYLK